MAIEDRARGEVIIRIVYDGPPLAGKTTSLRSLSEMLARSRRSDVYSPSDAEGRTLYFDWLDYLGGWLDGKQVRCQIISLPGQRALAARRALLLRDADVVILVFDSTYDGVSGARFCYQQLQEHVRAPGDPMVPVVFQANKQDLPGALSTEVLREELSDVGLFSIVPSNATNGRGVREAFTFAVRIALDRIRELVRARKLREGAAEITSGEELLGWLESEERARARAPIDVSVSAPEPARAELGRSPTKKAEPATTSPRSTRPSGGTLPRPPTSQVPSGLVWPPMTGRIVLHEFEDAGVSLLRTAQGDLRAAPNRRWLIWSARDSCYEDLEVGRTVLLEAARYHARLGPLLSEHRAVVLAETGERTWRLWKVSRIDASLRAALDAFLEDPEGGRLLSVASGLIEAEATLRTAAAPLPLSLENVGARSGRVFYTGIVPDEAEPSEPVEAATLLYRELGAALQELSEKRNHRVPQLLKELREHAVANPAWAPMVDTLSLMLIGD